MKRTEFIGITSRNMHLKFEAVWRSYNFWQKNAQSDEPLEKGWNNDIFSKFSEIHETYRIYWNHLQEHADEIWGSLEKLQFLTEKCRQRRSLEKRMKLWHFLKVLQNSWNLQNLLESPPRTCIWNLRQFGEVTIFDRKMPTALDLRKRMKLWHFLKVLQNSWNLQNLLESLPETCMWNLRLFGEVTIFDRKMPAAPTLRKRMKLWHFLKVLQNSWNLQNLLESLPETCMWNLRLFGEVTIFDRKMPTAPDLRKRMKLWHFLKVLQNSWNLQNLLESPPRTCIWNLRQFGEVTIFYRKMPTALDLRKRMKLWYFLKVLQNSWNLQNLLESLPETCMWNLRLFGEVTIFDSKMPQRRTLEKRWNYDIFSKFSKIHETYRIYWNHLQEHASEIWGSLEKLQFLTEKCRQHRTLEKRMKLWHFLKVLQNSWNLQNLLESPPRTCIWNLRQFGEVTIFDRKMPTAPDLRKKDEIMTFSQSSPKFMKLTEFIGITSKNMHLKFEAVWRSYNFWQKNAHSAGP